VVAVVEDDLEHPVGGGDLGRREEPRPAAGGGVEERRAVAVADALDVAVGGAADVVPRPAVALVEVRRVDAGAVLRLVAVERGVALVVPHLADQPAEDARGVERVGDPRAGVEPVDREHVVAGRRAPVDVARGADPGPALDAREAGLDPGAVAADAVAVELVVRPVRRHQVLDAGEQEDVGLLGVPVPVEIPGQAGVGLAGDRGQGEAPAEAERAVPGAGVVGERELRPEPRAPGAGGDRDRHRAGAGDRVGGELLADAADRAAALRQRHRRRREADRLGRAPGALAAPGVVRHVPRPPLRSGPRRSEEDGAIAGDTPDRQDPDRSSSRQECSGS
jgi:hypothetical protein